MVRNLSLTIAGLAVLALAAYSLTEYESYSSLYDATYTGSAACGECHTVIYPEWQRSPHANMTRRAGPDTVVGDFGNHEWFLPEEARRHAEDHLPAARMIQEGDTYYMSLRDADTREFKRFAIDYVVGYQYRQTYLTQERNGVLRRLPLQWSTETAEFFPYWNFQERSAPTLTDLAGQMTSLNSAWNLFCARCHTTKLTVVSKDDNHTVADAHWVDDGIACEACHGPGSQHVNYMFGNPVNRIASYFNSRLRGEPVAYIANARDLTKGQSLSVCARCHGSDIFRSTMDIYRNYEPGYSQEGRINDLSGHFTEAPLVPGRDAPTVEVWSDGRPKGIGMLFRSFVESSCYANAEVRCYDCHNPHDNKQPANPGLLEASAESNAYCLGCHGSIESDTERHTRHRSGEPGSYCYDCHMPLHITNAATGVVRMVRTHTMSDIPNPAGTARYGDQAPNACNDCHADRTPEWAQQTLTEWR